MMCMNMYRMVLKKIGNTNNMSNIVVFLLIPSTCTVSWRRRGMGNRLL